MGEIGVQVISSFGAFARNLATAWRIKLLRPSALSAAAPPADIASAKKMQRATLSIDFLPLYV
jgi:hypothetical protein